MHLLSLSYCDYLEDCCNQVASKAKFQKKRQWLAICYDEIVRRAWSERARANDASLDIANEAKSICKDALSRAGDMYDGIEAKLQAQIKQVM